MPSLSSVLPVRRLALAAGVVAIASFGLAYRFALRYRERAGLPHQSPVEGSPEDFGLEFESVEIPSGEALLAGWFVPAASSDGYRRQGGVRRPRPAIAIVHGWESNRGRSMAHIRYLHAAGFHCLAIDVRGHGDNEPESLPINVPEFGADAAAAVRWLAGRPEVSTIGLLGHSMGGAGAIVAAADEPAVGAVVALSSPADLVRMTRQTFELAELRVPRAVATPLAWLTAAVLLAPRRHSIEQASACVAAARYRGPLLLIHGEDDHGVPVAHMELIAQAARDARSDDGSAPVETIVVPGYGHRWLYEDTGVRRRTASFFAAALSGPVAPRTAGRLAAECIVERPENPVYGFGSLSAAQRDAAEARERARPRPRATVVSKGGNETGGPLLN